MIRFLARHRSRFTARLQEAQRQAEDWQQHVDDALDLFGGDTSEPLPPPDPTVIGRCANPECQFCNPAALTARDIIEAWRVGIDLR